MALVFPGAVCFSENYDPVMCINKYGNREYKEFELNGISQNC